MLTEKDYEKLREELDNCQKPLFFFDDDPDGLCSFLLLYRYKNEGKGIIVKTHPKLDTSLLPKVEEYEPDKVFILDVPVVQQEFINGCKRPVIWIDHHGPSELAKVTYFNPRIKNKDEHIPTSNICYNAVKQDLWIAATGTVADWFFPPFIDEFRRKYPELLPESIKMAPDAIYNSELGKLIKIFSFILKGTTSDAMKYVKVLTRIKEPYEILNQTTSQGRFVYKRYEKINEMYQELMKYAKKKATRSRLLIYTYQEDKMSFSSDISNELIYCYPNKIIIVARNKGGEMKGSIRSTKINLQPVVQKALAGVEGYGGGHEHACGFCVKEEDFERFVKNIKDGIKEVAK